MGIQQPVKTESSSIEQKKSRVGQALASARALFTQWNAARRQSSMPELTGMPDTRFASKPTPSAPEQARVGRPKFGKISFDNSGW